MRPVAAVLACLFAGSAMMLAQEGHPLTGSWHGDYGTSPTQRTQFVFLMHWDTKNVVGNINPGANAIPLKVATLDPSKWQVHFEADMKDQAGKPVHMVFDGKLDNVGSYNRTITGTWTSGAQKGDFKLTRD
ncbi:MAG: hypothetical protein JWO19_3277 [Bryobacterales bacterium]|nr:hypothetical protein [Bryobacterales bacterium]